MIPRFVKYYFCVIVTLVLFCSGMAIGRMIAMPHDNVSQWMPVKVLDSDIARLIVLESKPTGATYTRFAKEDGTWGIIAVRQAGGIWVVPCQEVGSRMAGENDR